MRDRPKLRTPYDDHKALLIYDLAKLDEYIKARGKAGLPREYAEIITQDPTFVDKEIYHTCFDWALNWLKLYGLLEGNNEQ